MCVHNLRVARHELRLKTGHSSGKTFPSVSHIQTHFREENHHVLQGFLPSPAAVCPCGNRGSGASNPNRFVPQERRRITFFLYGALGLARHPGLPPSYVCFVVSHRPRAGYLCICVCISRCFGSPRGGADTCHTEQGVIWPGIHQDAQNRLVPFN